MTQNDRIDFLFRLLTDDAFWFYWQLLNAPLVQGVLDDQTDEHETPGQVH